MTFKPLQAPSSDFSPLSKELAKHMISKPSAKVVAWSKIMLVKKKLGENAVKEQVIDENTDDDDLTLYSRRFDRLKPDPATGKITVTLYSDYDDTTDLDETLIYDVDLDVFYSEHHTASGQWYGVPVFVETPEDFTPPDVETIATRVNIPLVADWGLRDPTASEILSKLRRSENSELWKTVKKYNIIDINPAGADNGKDGIYIWNGSKLLALSNAESTSTYGVNPSSIKAISDVPIGYFSDPNTGLGEDSVEWFDVKTILPKDKDSKRRDTIFEDNTNELIVPGISNDQGGHLQFYSFILKNQKYRVVAYTSGITDPRDVSEYFLNYLEKFTQYHSRSAFMKKLGDSIAANTNGNQGGNPIDLIPNALKSLLEKFDEKRTLFLPLTWRRMVNKDVDSDDEKLMDVLKDDDDDSQDRGKRSSSPLAFNSRISKVFKDFQLL